MMQLLCETVWHFLSYNTELPHDLVIPRLVYTQRIESRNSKRFLYTHYTATLFTIAKKMETRQMSPSG